MPEKTEQRRGEEITPVDENVHQIKRHSWEKVTVSRHIFSWLAAIIIPEIVFGVFVVIAVFLTIFSGADFLAGFLLLVLLTIALLNVLYIIYTFMYWKSVRFTLIPGTFRVVSDFVDTTPGEIVVEKGVIVKRKSTFPLRKQSKLKIFSGIFGQSFGYGTIIIFDEENSPSFTMTSINNPEEVANKIQSMINVTQGDQLIDPGGGPANDSSNDSDEKDHLSRIPKGSFYKEPNDKG